MSNDLTRVVKVLKGLKQDVDASGFTQGNIADYPTKSEVTGAITVGVSDAKNYINERETAITEEYKETINEAITALKGVAPETLDTLQEISEALQNNPDVIRNILTSLGEKADSSELTTHANNKEVHVTIDNKNEWNAKVSTQQLVAETKVSDPTLAAWLTNQSGA